MDPVGRGFLLVPQGGLRLVEKRGILLANRVRIENRLVLELVTAKPQAKVFLPKSWQRTSKPADSSAS
jgi:hypothetical protein